MIDDVVREFLAESAETLDRVEVDLVALERDPGDAERLARVFRGLHTIKGNCGFLAFLRLESLSHAGESVLSCLREGSLTLDGRVVADLLRMVDVMRRMLAHVERTGVEPVGDDVELIAGLRGRGDRRRDEDRGTWRPNPAVRVDVAALDRLMALVTDLAAARDAMLQFAPSGADSSWTRAATRLHHVTTELGDAVTALRMQPIGALWNRFPRVVRDLAAQTGKQVELRMDGHETSLDRAVLEAIKDPLTHVLRNAVAHGIERPDVRRQAGKPDAGLLWLRAERRGDRLTVQVADDGAGIDPAVIRRAAVHRGFVSSGAAARLSDAEIVELVFQPGLTTTPRATTVSGRGVGMDILRTNVERIGGRVRIQSRPGQGTTIVITIPLSPDARVASHEAETADAR